MKGQGNTMKILCFGDSNTYGYDPRSFFGSRYPEEYRWVDLLARKLNCTAVNAGENGREIPSRELEYARFHQLLARHKPVDRLLIMLGTNDLLQGNAPETVARRMAVFLESVDLDRSRILLLAPPPLAPGEWVTDQRLIDASAALSLQYNTLCRRLGVAFADAGAWHIPLAFDGVHFTQEGHRAFAEALEDYLNKGE